ncbi:hypothetical protein DPMN_061360 [Dreissena polymorpha]|uniref:Uncharacterized protein n=1 Tax=Dreissena polymorpha TaxID=45954 RepID=A0A9D4C7A5_DREPO|nr:hypothetical protein DPMN_061360 [Dreissena polymorpha]
MFFKLTGTIFKLNSHIKETNVLNKFHENWANNVTSRVEKCPAHWRPCFSPIWTIFELVRDINKTNVLTNFHDDWQKLKTAPPGSHVIQLTGTIFVLNSYIKETNVLTKFHENWAKIEKCPAHWRPYLNKTNVLTNFMMIGQKLKTAPPHGSHVFSTDRNHFRTQLLYQKKCPAHCGHVFHSPIWTIFELPCYVTLTGTIFELNSHIKETNVLTKFHENWAKNVTSRVEKCPPTGGQCVSKPIWTIFELVRDLIKPMFLTNFHDDWGKNCDF